MITSELIGGLGNRMFQYSLGRIIADIKNYNHFTSDLETLSQYFPNISNVTDRITTTDNTIVAGYGSNTNCIQHVDIQSLLDHNGGIYLKGFFQKHYLYSSYRSKLQELFKFANDKSKPGDNDIVVHVRLGDYVQLNHYLSPSVYLDIINRLEYDNCIIITDDPNNEFLKNFHSLRNCHIMCNSTLDDYAFIYNAKRAIISQSTFSWWPTFLGNQDQVYVPLFASHNGYPWKLNPGIDDIDLIPTCDKYIKVPI
jgi:hypothetical protein